MNTEANQEIWQVETGGDVFEARFDEMTAWIADGSLLRIDRVRKGNLRWIEAGKVPSLLDFFNAKDLSRPLSPVISTTRTEILGVAAPTQTFANPKAATARSTVRDSDVCSMHEDVPAYYICETCSNQFCKACPNSYGGNVKICPFCGAMCKPLAQAQNPEANFRPADGEGFGFGDFGKALAHPFKFKTSLILGAIMFMLFSLGQSVVGFGGIFMMFSALICALMANMLTFGILANTVENFSQGKLDENFMPSFDDFSLWDDVVQPFFLSIGVYLSSFGPFIAVMLVAVFMMIGSVQKEMNGLQSDAARTVNPELPYAANAVKQSEKVKELLKNAQDSQKKRIEAMERGAIEGEEITLPDRPAINEEQNFEQMNKMIQDQRKAQLESAFGKTPETVAKEREAMLGKIMGYGVVFLMLGGITLLWGLFYLPAACAVAGYTRSFWATLNPAVGIDTIRRLGFSYVLILVMTFLLIAASVVLSGFLFASLAAFDLPGVGNMPAKAIGSLFGFYLSVVFSCLIGYALYKASDRLKLPR
ncbi:MAG: hypothetical protein ACKVQJ_12070 [Pyrinomonadaceae bacterium]